MFKYKNISNLKLAVSVNNRIIYINPNQTISSDAVLSNKFLVDVTEYPKAKDIKVRNKGSDNDS